MQQIAEAYVRLTLAIGTHDPDHVDAYYGPPEWRAQPEATTVPLPEIERRASALLSSLRDRLASETTAAPSLDRLRCSYLDKQLGAMVARVRMLQGVMLSFDDEARALYDATPPVVPEEQFHSVLTRLDRLLPGTGSIHGRYVEYRSRFIVRPERLASVFEAAIAAGRTRTSEHIAVPPDESFVVEYVTDKPWSGYNWYKGGYHSVIQVNTSLPIYIDRAVDLACHEGYPGHHVYNALLERHLVRERGWPEFSVYALFSPQSLIAEGTANYGIEIVFPPVDRVEFERTTLFPLAGLPPDAADDYYRVQDLVHELSYAGNEAARRYLNGEIDAGAACAWLERYALMAPAAARQRVRFFDRYRSYVINYNVGQDLVKAHVERHVGPDATAGDRWRVFGALLSSPRVPSDL